MTSYPPAVLKLWLSSAGVATPLPAQKRTAQADGRNDVADLDDDHAAHSSSTSQWMRGGSLVSVAQRAPSKHVMHEGKMTACMGNSRDQLHKLSVRSIIFQYHCIGAFRLTKLVLAQHKL